MRGNHPLNVGKRILVARSCSTCSIFQDAQNFKKTHLGYWQTQCRKCQYRTAKSSTMKANHESWDTASRAGEPWLASDIKELEDLLAEGLSYKDISKKIGRSIQAINKAKFKFLRKE